MTKKSSFVKRQENRHFFDHDAPEAVLPIKKIFTDRYRSGAKEMEVSMIDRFFDGLVQGWFGRVETRPDRPAAEDDAFALDIAAVTYRLIERIDEAVTALAAAWDRARHTPHRPRHAGCG
ncbi:MAG: hypothetical protein ACOY3L_12290 [Pseudomonadota bacterium]